MRMMQKKLPPQKQYDKKSVGDGALRKVFSRITLREKFKIGLSGRSIWLPGLLHGVDQANELFGGVGYGNIIMLAFSSLLSKVCGKGRIPIANKLRGVENGIAQVSRAPFLHVGIAI